MNTLGLVAGILAAVFYSGFLVWQHKRKSFSAGIPQRQAPHWYKINVFKEYPALTLEMIISLILFLFFILALLLSFYALAGIYGAPLSLLICVLLYIGGFVFCLKWRALWRYIAQSEVKGDEDNAGITFEILLLAGLGVSVVWLAWDFYQSNCAMCAAASGGFCALVKDSAGAFLPLITSAATGPILLFWWLRRDKHKCQDLKHQSTRLHTERFSHAVELLGHKDDVSVRLGGIYALERLARDSEADHWTVMETLAAYVREHAKLNPEAAAADREAPNNENEAKKPATDAAKADREAPNNENEAKKPATDVQAALTVLGRRKREHREKEKTDEGQVLDLSNCDLRGADMLGHKGPDGPDGHYANADFYKSNLQRADLRGADLQGARFPVFAFSGGLTLIGVNLANAYLNGANLRDAILKGARLFFADLRRADLRGANLQEADLQKANLEHAIFDEETILPFDEVHARERGMVKVDEVGKPLPGWKPENKS